MEFDISEIKAYFSCQQDVIVAYLFGSVARDQDTYLSDLDIAVLLEPGLGDEEQMERQLQLTADLEAFTYYEVQVTLLNGTTPFLAYQVVREGKLLYERDANERVNFEVQAMKKYFDFQGRLDFYTQTVMDDIQEIGLGKRRRRSAPTLDAARRVRERLEEFAGS